MKEATEVTEVTAEQPKTTKHKGGNKIEGAAPDSPNGSAATTPDGATKTKTPKLPKESRFRLMAGVDINKFKGQRHHVVKALQSLGEGYHSLGQITQLCDGLQSKAETMESVFWHLKGLIANNEVEALLPEKPAVPLKKEKTETPVEEAVAA